MAATGAMLIFLIQNRVFRATRGGMAMIYLLALNLILLLIRVTSTYPIGTSTRFLGADDANFNNVAWTLLISLFLQMAFMAIAIGRRRRTDFLILRRKIRFAATAQSLAIERKEVAKLAAERFSLLKMLTHEVRQPLNNAQAALQSMLDDLARHKDASPSLDKAVRRAQKTLGSIALSVSNSIVGASLIHQNRPVALEMTDLCAVAHLALLDATPDERKLIEIHFDQDVIYANADPIILRLAIRNLVENALKYSPPASPIQFGVRVDEQNLATIISVRNTLTDPVLLEGDIFAKETRGADSSYEGSGLGLYIVREVAKIHQGTLDYWIDGGDQVTFSLSIPS
jgi:signal transduction histidine kinase